MRRYRNILIDMFATPNATWAAGGISTSNTYPINAYNNTVATSGNDFTPEKATFYHRAFIKNHVGRLVHGQFGEKLIMPKHSGDVVNVRGQTPYPTATTPLQEGVTPAGNVMNYYYVEIPVYQYGKYTPITDWASFCSRDDILVHDIDELSSQSGRTLEEIDRDALNAGMSVVYAPYPSNGTLTEVSGRSGINAGCKLTMAVIYRAVNYLENQNADTINGSWVAIIHPDCKYDIMTSEGFINVVKYHHAERIFNGEIGMIGNVRFVVSTFAKVFTGAGTYISGSSGPKVDVYSTLVIGKDAYKVIEIEGNGMQTIIKGFGSGGTADPLNQRATQGWKTSHGIGITGETNMVRIESASGVGTTAAWGRPLHDNEYLIEHRPSA